jgi:hypothetical protein
MLGELTPAQIEDVLRTEVVARIGCHAGGRTYVVPIAYAYDGVGIIAHSGQGLKVRMMRENPDVCVEVDRLDDMAHWQSVIAWGRYEELTGDAAVKAIETLVDRLAPLVASETSVPPHSHQPSVRAVVVYRIRLTEKTGRYEHR